MKHLISTLLLSIAFLSSCGQTLNYESKKVLPEIQLSESEELILDSIEFDSEVLKLVRAYTDSSIYILSTSFNYYIDSLKQVNTITKKHNGFSFKAEQGKANEIVYELKDRLKNKGYLIYISDVNFGYSSDEISLLKSNDQFDILRVEETDGINYGFENKDVIAKLQEWNNIYPFQIISAGLDWVEAIFIKRPDNMRKFAKELYEFCPDIVEQGVGSVNKLEKEMERSGILYLWWD